MILAVKTKTEGILSFEASHLKEINSIIYFSTATGLIKVLPIDNIFEIIITVKAEPKICRNCKRNFLRGKQEEFCSQLCVRDYFYTIEQNKKQKNKKILDEELKQLEKEL